MNSLTPSSFSVLLWNANGLYKHKYELTTLLNGKDIDIALISETHLTDRLHFHITGYTSYQTNHPDGTAHGGTAILVKRNISHFPEPENIALDSLQTTTITIQSPSSPPISIAAVYSPPNQALCPNSFHSFLKSLGSRFIAGGDYNAKHPQYGCRIANSRGNALLPVLTSSRFKLLSPDRPTYWPTSRSKQPDIVDYFITSGLSHVPTQISTLYDLSSDHSPVLLQLNVDPNSFLQSPKPSLIQGQVDWKSFHTFLESSLDLNSSLKTENELDDAVNHLTSHIQSAIFKTSTTSKQTHRNIHTLPENIKQLIAVKRKARKTWQRTRYPSHKTYMNKLSKQLKNALKTHENDAFAEYTHKLTQDNKTLWTAAKRILNYNKSIHPLRRNDNTWAKSDYDIATTFAESLSNTFRPHNEILDPDHCNLVSETLDIPLPLSLPPKAFQPSEVLSVIKRLPNRKSPGYDLITPLILKNLPRKALLFLTNIYNAILRTTYYPILWKFAKIIMIHKKGKPFHSPESYRPISLLSNLGKILEKLLLKRLYPILDPYLPDHQFGFRFSHSTVQQCHRIVDRISLAFERKEYCSGVFIDVAQAFDRVWHEGLLFKLKALLPSTYFLILKSYLSDRNFQVDFSSSSSPTFSQLAGVPQGGILSPLLFLIYTADIPTHPFTSLYTFADDTALLSSDPNPVLSSQHLQEHLDILHPWLTKWRIKVNPSKSTHITFTLRRSTCPPVFLSNSPIPSKSQIRYLGLTLDKRLTWSPHIITKKHETRYKYKQLLRLLDRRSKLTLTNKRLLYNTIIKPTWTYGLELWGSAKPSNIQKLQSLQSIILRKIADAPPYVSNLSLHTDLNVPFIHDLVPSRYNKFFSRLPGHPNPQANSLYSPFIPTNPRRRLKRKWPRDLLASDFLFP